MKIIKNSKELSELVDENKDLFLKEEDIRIEFEPSRNELRNVYCKDLFLMNDLFSEASLAIKLDFVKQFC